MAAAGQTSAKPKFTRRRKRWPKRAARMTLVMDSASKGLCNRMAKNTPAPIKPPCSVPIRTLAPRAIPSTKECRHMPVVMPNQLSECAPPPWSSPLKSCW